ncbi:peptide chain release factor N(5)-glutamine methyltransferase [uncultured Microbacterium sp.]|uniref:peptide chain release factor N(5)-glutamine methyltransferase n=1 Tax=uncultured Microbacterium sp. TaxID=191216 RepID=UPI0026159B45|nr:peptide chain release factor N(5)-glutamine methyltransferase [uncultured Microbacterium sp.]
MPEQTIAAAVRAAAARLAEVGVPDPLVDAELLVGHVRGLGRGEVQATILRGDSWDEEAGQRFLGLVERRAAREPLQHITGRAPFRHLELAVGPGVFVPRPETEMVAQFAIDALVADASEAPIGVDLCTGSGAIALALATEVPHSRVFAVELSDDAHAWAARNTASAGNLTLVHGDLADALPELDGSVSVVISNPPYVPDDALPRDPEVRLHDPAMALYGGPDGLDIVRVLSARALRLLRAGGLLVIEHGELQGRQIRDLLTADGWRAADTHPDLTHRDRATTAIRP